MATRRDDVPPPTAELMQLEELTDTDIGRSVRVLGRYVMPVVNFF